MTVVRYEPWALLNRLHREFDQTFDTAARDASWAPAVDIHEEAQRFVVRADLPGVKPADIEVTADKGVLTPARRSARSSSAKSMATTRASSASAASSSGPSRCRRTCRPTPSRRNSRTAYSSSRSRRSRSPSRAASKSRLPKIVGIHSLGSAEPPTPRIRPDFRCRGPRCDLGTGGRYPRGNAALRRARRPSRREARRHRSHRRQGRAHAAWRACQSSNARPMATTRAWSAPAASSCGRSRCRRTCRPTPSRRSSRTAYSSSRSPRLPRPSRAASKFKPRNMCGDWPPACPHSSSVTTMSRCSPSCTCRRQTPSPAA